MSEKPDLIVDLTFSFSLRVNAFTEVLESRRKYNMANQLFRSGTSIGANIREAQGAESKGEFKAQMQGSLQRDGGNRILVDAM